jgi:uncharacterized protein
LTFSQKMQFVRGKLQRFYDGHFRKDYVAQRLAARKGECKRCGACCRLLVQCAFAEACHAGTACRIYKRRPVNCRTFPYEPSHFAERDLLKPEQPCGYYFED